MADFVNVRTGTTLKTDNEAVAEQMRRHPEAYREVKASKSAPRATKTARK